MADQEINTSGGAAIQGDVNAKRDVVGRDLIENNYYDSLPPKLPADHPYRKYTLADVVAVLIGNDLTGDPGLVRRVIEIEKEMAIIREERRSRKITWFEVIMLGVLFVATIALIVTLGVFFSGLMR